MCIKIWINFKSSAFPQLAPVRGSETKTNGKIKGYHFILSLKKIYPTWPRGERSVNTFYELADTYNI